MAPENFTDESGQIWNWQQDPRIQEAMDYLGLTEEEAIQFLGLSDEADGGSFVKGSDVSTGLPAWFLASMFAPTPQGIGAIAGSFGGGAAASGAASGAGAAAPTTASLPLTSALPNLGAGVGLTAPPAVGAGLATGAGAAGAGGVGSRVGDFLQSDLGRGLIGTGLDALGGALSDDPPGRFEDLDGELGRLLTPANSNYIKSRSNLHLLQGLFDAVENPPQTPNFVPGQLSTLNVPGLPFSIGGVGRPSTDFDITPPSLNTGGGSKWVEQLLAPPPPPALTPTAPEIDRPTATAPANTRRVRQRQPRGR